MSTIDSRVVEMNFDGAKFGNGVDKTLTMLDRLKAALHLNGASKGLQDVNAAAQTFNSAPMEQGVGRIGAQFTAMQAIAFGALSSIGAKAMQTAQQIGASFSTGPIKQGFQEYETNMNSIQTILANTQAAGVGLEGVNHALDEMNHYSDKTIYNFSEMAKNVGTFTAAGVDLETATGSIKGIANLAALSGSNSQQAAGAMYQLSQEIAAGKVTLMGWNSVVNAGMGGTIFQRALAETAVAMGKIDSSALKLEGDMKNVVINGKAFRDSISAEGGQESWLTSDVLTNTLQQFTGDLNDAELAAQGFSQAQIDAIKKQAATAVGAATEVKTLTGLMDTLKEGVASGWAQSFRLLVGDFEEAKQLFTGISNSVGGFFGGIGEARNKMLTDWKADGGRDLLLWGLKDAATALFSVLKPIGEAFRQIFPATTAGQLVAMTASFRAFATSLIPSEETINNIRRTFAGLFAILGIGWELLKAGFNFFSELFGKLTEGSGSILNFTGNIGDFLVKLHETIKTGDVFTKFFDKVAEKLDMLGQKLDKPIQILKDLTRWIGQMFTGIDASGAAEEGLDRLSKVMEPLGSIGEMLVNIWGNVVRVFNNIRDSVGPIIGMLGEWFGNLFDGLRDSTGDIDWNLVLGGIQTGLLGGLVLMLKNFTANFSIFGDKGGEGMFDKLKNALDGLTGTLEAMQANLKANALLKIAGAIAIMAVSLLLLSTIDAAGLARASAAIAVMFVQLGAALTVFSNIGTPKQMAKLNLMAAALIGLSVAILLLAFAVKTLAAIDAGDMARGLLAITILIRALTKTSQQLERDSAGMIKSAASLIVLALAIRTLVWSVKSLAELDYEELGKGLVGVGVLLGALLLFSRYSKADEHSMKQGVGILLLAAALKVMAWAMKDFASMSWEELGKGMATVAVGLTALVLALRFMPDTYKEDAYSLLILAVAMKVLASAIKDLAELSWQELGQGVGALAITLGVMIAAMNRLAESVRQAAAILIVAAAIKILAWALKDLGQLSGEELATSLIALAGALTIIVTAMNRMEDSVQGAYAMGIVAAAIWLLAPALQALGSMSLEEMAKSLGMLVGVFVIIGIAAKLLAPAVPVLNGLALGIALLGAAAFLAGVGVLAFAMGLGLLAALGAAGVGAIVLIVTTLIGLIPAVMAAIGQGIIAFAMVIATAGPAILAAITTVLTAFLQAIIDTTPKVVETLLTLLFAFLHTLDQAIPRIIETGFRLLMALLYGIRDKIGEIVTVVAAIIIQFLNALARNLPAIIQAGINLMISFMNGIGDGLRRNGPAMVDAGWNMVSGMVEGFVKGIGQLGGKLVEAAKNMAKKAWDGAMDFLGIRSPSRKFMYVGRMSSEGMAVGLTSMADTVERAGENVGQSAIDGVRKTISGLGALLESDVDMQPTIAPVLDLSAVRKEAGDIGSLLAAKPLTVDSSYSGAASASAGYQSNVAVLEADNGSQDGEGFMFVQNNYSPKAISAAETFRNTRSQLSIAKEALKTNAD